MSSDSFIIGGQQRPESGEAGMAGADSGAGDIIKETTTENFAADVIDASRTAPVLVDFWAPWCGPCKQLTPILEAAIGKAGGKVRLVKMNIDDHPQIPGQLGIQSIPAVIAFKDGQPLDGFMGALPESQVMAFIERVAGPIGPSDTEQAVAAAGAALQAHDYTTAAGLYSAVLQGESDNLVALAGLAQCHIALGNLDQAKGLLSQVPDAKQSDAALAGVLAALDLAEKTSHLGNPDDLARQLESQPDDHQTRFDLALALNARGDRSGAVEQLVTIFSRDREWNEDAARKQLLQFFEAWGANDPATQKGRQRLSSVLFS
jgi:putative thioredoxin